MWRILGASLALSALAQAAPRVAKTHFDDDVRFLFLAGLEGTGHHTLGTLLGNAAFRGVVRTNSTLRDAIHSGCQTRPIGLSVMGDELEIRRKGEHASFDAEVHELDAAGTDLRQRQHLFRDMLQEAAAAARGPKLILLNGFEIRGEPGSSQISYPNCRLVHKPVHHPDVVEIAQAAEDAGVDLRILVLTRSAQAILTSTVLHRAFADGAFSAAYLAGNAAMLASQLQLIDPKFFACKDQASLLRVTSTEAAHADIWSRMGPFLHPGMAAGDLVSVTAGMGAKMRVRDPNNAMGGADGSAGAGAFVDHLERYVQLLDGVCEAE